MGELSWALTIATKDRLDALETCVRLALEQTLPPKEVVVADASTNWEMHAARIRDIVETHKPGLTLTYVAAQAPSTAVQRNQAVVLAKSDIVFLIDDDSFMFPKCAERVMAHYAADTDGAVVGIQASASASIPDAAQIEANRKITGAGAGEAQITTPSLLKRWLWRHVFLMSAEELFLPYDGTWPDHDLPATMAGRAVKATRLFQGYRMTFRRQAMLNTPFDGFLRYYSPGEDLDVSYRQSQIGVLLTATDAYLHHYTAASGRIDRRKTTHLSALNQAFLLHRHAANRKDAQARYARLMRRRLLAEFLKDGLSRRFSFPQMRGIWASQKQAKDIFAMTPDALEANYPTLQERLIKG